MSFVNDVILPTLKEQKIIKQYIAEGKTIGEISKITGLSVNVINLYKET